MPEDLPILIAGPEVDADRIHTFIRASGGSFATARMDDVNNLEDLRERINKNQKFRLIFIEMPYADANWLSVVREILANPDAGVLVILSDARDVVMACRELGQRFFLPIDQLNVNLLNDTIYAAQDHHKLSVLNHRLEDLYQVAEQRFKDVTDQFADWMWEIDADLNIIFSSSRKRPAQGAEPGMKFAGCFLPEEKLRVEDDFADLVRDPRPFHDRDYWSYDPYGSRMCWTISGVPVLDTNGELCGFRGIARDISAQKASADQLYHLANKDVMTGLYNRSRFYDELSRSIRQFAREQREGALVVMDIDKFNIFNDSYGQKLGDKLLIHLAQVLQDNVRSGDFLARVAGDEFAIIMPDVRAEDLDARVQRLMDAIHKRPLMSDHGTLTFNVSASVVRFPVQGRTADDLLTKAEMALHDAKSKGRNRIEKYKDQDGQSHTADGVEQLGMLEFVHQCLDHQEDRLILHFQPIVPLNGHGHKEFYEVLVRMVNQEGEIVPPVKFIKAAEDFGLVSKIDRIVTERVIDQLAKLHQEDRKVYFSVNLSGKTFDDDEFLEAISQKLEEAKLPKGTLVFEITETSLLRDMTRVRHFIDTMKKVGADFALDDCGMGYSSFNYIRHLALDYIKIDGTFIKNLHKNNEDEAFVQALNDIAKRKAIHTVAEMVERKEVVDKLKTLGVDYGQGFYFAMPAADLPDPEDTVH